MNNKQLKEHPNMSSEFDNWDPMKEAFSSENNYEMGPGVNLHCKENQSEKECKIFLRNLPTGITEKGIKNMCLSAGNPISVKICQSGEYGFVTFKTKREGELAIRDLNGTPPYYIKADFSIQKDNSKKDSTMVLNNSKELMETDKKWSVESFYKLSMAEKKNLIGNSSKNILVDVKPYFEVLTAGDEVMTDPSFVMRQKSMNFNTGNVSVSMGRAYINNVDLNRHKCDIRMFSSQSADWKDTECKISSCDYCGLITYEKDGENYCSKECETNATTKSVENSKSTIFEYFSPGVYGSLDFIRIPKGDIVKCCVVLNEKSEIWKQLMEYNGDDEVKRACKGDQVKVWYENERSFRGVVLSFDGDYYTVALTDYGEVISVEEVYELPDELRKLPFLGGVAVFLGDTPPNLSKVEFRIKEKRPFSSWLCELTNSEVLCEMLLEEWSAPESLTWVPLESGCRVVITTVLDMKSIFVRRIDDSWEENFIRFSNDICAYCLEAKRFKRPPKRGDVCAALDKSGYFLRAIVDSVRGQSIRVVFLDYGNREEIQLDALRYLPPAVRKINCFAVAIQLKNMPTKSTPEVVDYFNRLIANETVLDLNYDDGQVILTDETTGEIVNVAIDRMTIPIWEKDPSVFMKSGETYFLDSIEELEFIPGNVEDIYLMNVDAKQFQDSGQFWATHYRLDYLGHLNGELKQSITQYCSCLPDDPYLPRTGELCLVEHEGVYYRGVSLQDRSPPYDVSLIDFGTIVTAETKNMRKILREFLEMPGLAVECRVSDFDKLDGEKLEKLTEYMVKKNKSLLKNVKIVRKIEGTFEISLPYVQELLGTYHTINKQKGVKLVEESYLEIANPEQRREAEALEI